MLLNAGGSVGRCWSGFSTVVFIVFSFLTFCHKHKRGLVDTTNYSMHCKNNSSANIVMWFLKYMKAVFTSLLGHNYEHEQTDRTTKLSITFSVGFLSSYHTHMCCKKNLLPLLCDTKSSRTMTVHQGYPVLQPIHRSIQQLGRGEKMKKSECAVLLKEDNQLGCPGFSSVLDQIRYLRLMLHSSCSSECGIAEL